MPPVLDHKAGRWPGSADIVYPVGEVLYGASDSAALALESPVGPWQSVPSPHQRAHGAGVGDGLLDRFQVFQEIKLVDVSCVGITAPDTGLDYREPLGDTETDFFTTGRFGVCIHIRLYPECRCLSNFVG